MRKLYNLKYNSQADALLDLMNRKIVGLSLQEFLAGTIAVIIASPKLLSPAVFDKEMVMTTPPVYEEGFFVDVILERTEVFTNTVEGSTNTISGFVEVEPNEWEELQADKEFCKKVMDVFTLDNRALSTKMSTQELLQAATAFSGIKTLADQGSVTAIRDLIASIPVQMLSQERIDKYVGMLNDYLAGN